MAQVVRFYEMGGPDVLRLEEEVVPEPGPDEVRIRQAVIGVNFADISFRIGRYPVPLPSCLGSEAAGVIESVGSRVMHLRPGDRVAYGGSRPGSYASEQVVPAGIVVKLPEAIGFETAAGMMSAGLTAAFLLRRMWSLKAGDAVLLTAAAGGVGQIAVQWAKLLGLVVIGTVGSEKKVQIAKAAGCDHVIVHSIEDISTRVRELTGGQGVAVAFDSVGKDTIASSLKSVKRRGLLVSYGGASGIPPALTFMDIARNGSLHVSRPALGDYIVDPAERAELTTELLDHVAARRINIPVNHRYALADVSKAHDDMENRRTTGSIVLNV